MKLALFLFTAAAMFGQEKLLAVIDGEPVAVELSGTIVIQKTLSGRYILRLNVPVLPPPPAPVRMVEDRIKLDDIPVEQPSLDHTLSYTPAANSLVWACYRGQTWWTQVFDTKIPAGGTLTIKLPTGRIVQSGDILILMYLTYDQVAAPVAAPVKAQ